MNKFEDTYNVVSGHLQLKFRTLNIDNIEKDSIICFSDVNKIIYFFRDIIPEILPISNSIQTSPGISTLKILKSSMYYARMSLSQAVSLNDERYVVNVFIFDLAALAKQFELDVNFKKGLLPAVTWPSYLTSITINVNDNMWSKLNEINERISEIAKGRNVYCGDCIYQEMEMI